MISKKNQTKIINRIFQKAKNLIIEIKEDLTLMGHHGASLRS